MDKSKAFAPATTSRNDNADKMADALAEKYRGGATTKPIMAKTTAHTNRDMEVGQWRRGVGTYVVIALPDYLGLVLCERRHRGVGAPKREKVFLPAGAVHKMEVCDAW